MKETKSKCWVVMEVYKWEYLTVLGNLSLMAPSDGPDGFMPIFDSRAEAIAWSGSEENIRECTLTRIPEALHAEKKRKTKKLTINKQVSGKPSND